MVKTNKILTSLMLLAVCILTGCEKMPDDEAVVSSSSTSGKNVVISISGIDAGWDGNSTRSLVPISEVCSRVCFAVYQDDTRLVYKNQKMMAYLSLALLFMVIQNVLPRKWLKFLNLKVLRK